MLWVEKKGQSEVTLTPHPLSVLSRSLAPGTAELTVGHTQLSAPAWRGLLCRTRKEGPLLRRVWGVS